MDERDTEEERDRKDNMEIHISFSMELPTLDGRKCIAELVLIWCTLAEGVCPIIIKWRCSISVIYNIVKAGIQGAV